MMKKSKETSTLDLKTMKSLLLGLILAPLLLAGCGSPVNTTPQRLPTEAEAAALLQPTPALTEVMPEAAPSPTAEATATPTTVKPTATGTPTRTPRPTATGTPTPTPTPAETKTPTPTPTKELPKLKLDPSVQKTLDAFKFRGYDILEGDFEIIKTSSNTSLVAVFGDEYWGLPPDPEEREQIINALQLAGDLCQRSSNLRDLCKYTRFVVGTGNDNPSTTDEMCDVRKLPKIVNINGVKLNIPGNIKRLIGEPPIESSKRRKYWNNFIGEVAILFLHETSHIYQEEEIGILPDNATLKAGSVPLFDNRMEPDAVLRVQSAIEPFLSTIDPQIREGIVHGQNHLLDKYVN